MFVSLTRLRLRSALLFPRFAVHAILSRQQLRASPGFVRGAVLADRRLTFWTPTAWESAESMRQYMTSGAHKAAMPKLMHWCDEACVAHWEQADASLPDWSEADRRMRASGRVSKVLYPSEDHAGMSHRPPRVTTAMPL